VDEQLILVRAIHFAATLTVAGVMIFLGYVAEPALRGEAQEGAVAAVVRVRLAWLAWISLAVAVVSGAAWLIVLAQQLSDGTVTAVLRDGIVHIVLTRTGFGADWMVRFGLAALLAMLLPFGFARRTAWGRGLAALIAAGLAGSLAFAGHAVASPGVAGLVHLVADILHLIAAAAWLGALAPLAMLLHAVEREITGREPDKSPNGATVAIAREATRRFSNLGVVSVGTLVATGIVNSWMLVGDVAGLVDTDYGRLLAVKIALFGVMVAIAAVNRLRLTPRLLQADDTGTGLGALGALRRNSLIEAGIGAIILIIVGELGTLPPGLHENG
jgi:putative copper resistance protein D